MSFAIRRFDFTGLQDFAAPPVPVEVSTDHTLPEVEELAPPPPPSFSEEELEAAKSAAWEEGRIAGESQQAESQNVEEKRRAQAIETAAQEIAQQAKQLLAQHEQFKALQTNELSGLVMVLAKKVAGDALQASPASAVENILEDCLGIMQTQPKLSISVHPDIAPDVDSKLREMVEKNHLESVISIRVNEHLGKSEVRVDWPDGSAERDMNVIWEQIETKVNDINFAQLAKKQDDNNKGEQA